MCMYVCVNIHVDVMYINIYFHTHIHIHTHTHITCTHIRAWESTSQRDKISKPSYIWTRHSFSKVLYLSQKTILHLSQKKKRPSHPRLPITGPLRADTISEEYLFICLYTYYTIIVIIMPLYYAFLQ
jgi:hypothetical protein